MRALLDTHVLIWAIAEPKRLPGAIADELSDPGNAILFSAASIWEIAIKYRLRRPEFLHEPNVITRAAVRTGFVELPVHASAAALVTTLRDVHRDPFDRLLIAQAIAEPARFYTADAALEPYSDLVKLVV
jgi:PIN domain nuclease of toxin-antitoxin system